jgi:hemin uptake protein HemP
MEAYPNRSEAGPIDQESDWPKMNQGGEISSASLFGCGKNEVLIEHRGEQYRLRQTRNGKLILTK